MIKGKRGVSDAVFKWFFGVVAGGLILIFFTRFAYQHISLSEKINIRETIENLDDQLEGFSISESSSKIIPFNKELELKFVCESYGGGDYLKKTTRIIFAPRNLNGDSLSAWTERWKFPFNVVNFYYLGNRNARFLLIYDDRYGNFVRNKLEFPSIFNLQKIHFRDFDINKVRLESSSLDQINLVFFRPVDNPDAVKKAMKMNVNVVEVDADTNKVKINGEESFYLSNEMLEGAIIGAENYKCLLNKALERLSLVSEVYMQKASLLRLKTHEAECEGLYTGIALNLQGLKRSRDKQELIELKDNLEEQNRMLDRNGCIELF
ncbi:MAG: hypothetical protein AABY07_10430 [Nanoarchaeota archaeon]